MKLDRSVTRLCRSIIRRERGNATIVAIECGVDLSRVSHWLNDESSVPADAIVPICRGLETIEPIRAMAAELGMDLVPLAQSANPVAVTEGVWSLLGHASTVGTEVRQAVADGTVDAVEANRIRRALMQAREVIDAMAAALPAEDAAPVSKLRGVRS